MGRINLLRFTGLVASVWNRSASSIQNSVSGRLRRLARLLKSVSTLAMSASSGSRGASASPGGRNPTRERNARPLELGQLLVQFALAQPRRGPSWRRQVIAGQLLDLLAQWPLARRR